MRRVRLTEGQLHNVIKESVNQILNEIDWKTYNNAARKKYSQMQNPADMDEYKRDVWPLYQASTDAIRRKYPHADAEGYDEDNMSPEAWKEYLELKKDIHNYDEDRYKYEKGGRGYYVDDDEEE